METGERFRELENRVTKVEAKVDSHMDDIKEIKQMQQQVLKWMVGALGSSLLTLVVVLINFMRT